MLTSVVETYIALSSVAEVREDFSSGLIEELEKGTYRLVAPEEVEQISTVS